MKTIVHVNRFNIAFNRKNPNKKFKPVFSIKDYKDNRYGFGVEILDKQGKLVAQFVYRPHKPLSCGAAAWFESDELTMHPIKKFKKQKTESCGCKVLIDD